MIEGREEKLTEQLVENDFTAGGIMKFRIAIAVVGILEQIARSFYRYVHYKTGRGE